MHIKNFLLRFLDKVSGNCGAIFDDMETCERNSCVHGYHVYKDIWNAVIGEELVCEREPDNKSDRYAVAVRKDRIIIGHLPRKISRTCSLFLRRGSEITCRVTGHTRYSVDLPQGGLEVCNSKEK